jgi:hypothetical protein
MNRSISVLRMTTTKLMLGLLLMAGALLGIFAPAPDIARGALIYTVTQGGVSTSVTPLSEPGKSTVAYYGYSSGDSSSHTGLEENGKSLLFLYEDRTVSPSKISLIITHDAIGGGGGGKVDFDITGIDTTARLISSDDPREFKVYYNSGLATGRWQWLDCCTDGGAMFMGSNPVDITIAPTFYSGIDQWELIVGNGETVVLDLTKPVTITNTGVDSDLDNDGYDTDAVLGGLDCDDTDPAINPDAIEIPYDGIDQDCNGEDLTDVDGDGYSAGAGGDCDDTNAAINPGTPEIIGDGIDNDCNAATLDDPDNDNDGYSLIAGGDCDDTDATIFPGAPEIANDGIDQDCNGEDLTDVDGDGFSGGAGGDCDDTNAAVFPGAPEVSDGVDNDCDGIFTKGDVLIMSGIDNGGIRTAPGLLEPYNPDSKGGEKAGKKK